MEEEIVAEYIYHHTNFMVPSHQRVVVLSKRDQATFFSLLQDTDIVQGN